MKYKIYLNEQEFAHGVSRQPVSLPFSYKGEIDLDWADP